MPIDLSYIGIVSDIVLKSGIGVVLTILAVYRILAASVLPCLAYKSSFCFFWLMSVVAFFVFSPCVDNSIAVIVMMSLLLAPYLYSGYLGITKKWSWKRTVIFSVLELLLFPLWFFIVFLVALLLEGDI